MWWIVALILLGSAGGVSVVVCRYWRRRQDEQMFFEESNRLFGYSAPLEAMAFYDTTRQDFYEKWKSTQPANDLLVPGGGEPLETTNAKDDDSGHELNEANESWQRQLPQPIRAQLMSALVKRAMANIPRYSRVTKEWQSKHALYKQRLLSDQHWNVFNQAHEDLSEEIRFIRFEAECLEPGWGKDDKVFEDAAVLFKHIQEKQQRELRALEMIREKEMETIEQQNLEGIEGESAPGEQKTAASAQEEEINNARRTNGLVGGPHSHRRVRHRGRRNLTAGVGGPA